MSPQTRRNHQLTVEVHSETQPDVLVNAIATVVTDHPSLILVSTDPERFSASVLKQLAHQVAYLMSNFLLRDATYTDQEPIVNRDDPCMYHITPQCVKKMLQSIHDPDILASYQFIPQLITSDRRGLYLVQMLTAAVAALEHPYGGCEPDMRGTILRMRYLERHRVQTVMDMVHLSERHYHRLHTSGLEWVTARLRESLYH